MRHDSPPCTAAEALARLKAGNERFLQGEARFPTVQKEVLAELAKGQRPYATILGCSDSRVPPELIFDSRFGELFIVRVAGNVVSPEILGTLQYAGIYLHTPLFVVLGHEGCGAITAALAVHEEDAVMPSRIGLLLDNVLPALDTLPAGLTGDQRTHAAVEQNVRWSIHQIVATPEGQARLAEGHVTIVGAVYELETGRVRFLD
jgi:carbonic anhydrase